MWSFIYLRGAIVPWVGTIRFPILLIDILEVKGPLGSLIHWLGFQPLNLSTTAIRLSCIDSRGTIYRAPALLVPGHCGEPCIGKLPLHDSRKDRSNLKDSLRCTLPRYDGITPSLARQALSEEWTYSILGIEYTPIGSIVNVRGLGAGSTLMNPCALRLCLVVLSIIARYCAK